MNWPKEDHPTINSKTVARQKGRRFPNSEYFINCRYFEDRGKSSVIQSGISSVNHKIQTVGAPTYGAAHKFTDWEVVDLDKKLWEGRGSSPHITKVQNLEPRHYPGSHKEVPMMLKPRDTLYTCTSVSVRRTTSSSSWHAQWIYMFL